MYECTITCAETEVITINQVLKKRFLGLFCTLKIIKKWKNINQLTNKRIKENCSFPSRWKKKCLSTSHSWLLRRLIKTISWLKNLAFLHSWVCEVDCQTVVLLRNMLEIEVVILVLKFLSDKYLPIVAFTFEFFIFVTYVNVK